MPSKDHQSPAGEAATAALEAVFGAIEKRESFVLEAGAGAGKTYSLVKALQFLIKKQGPQLLTKGQRVACITYTNVASDEIKSRTDRHPAILSCTVHSFCWALISPFQAALRLKLPLIPKWAERLAHVGGIGGRRIDYNLGHASVREDVALLGHDDVITLAASLMEETKFRSTVVSRFPMILIDEYQDTNQDFARAVIQHFIATRTGPLIGFFGDHWQKIYDDGCGQVDDPGLKVIGKGANFRSAPAVVSVLNAMRPTLVQAVKDPTEDGSVGVYHTNARSGPRRKEAHWKGDLPAEEAHACLKGMVAQLENEGWSFDPNRTKILMLTHNVLAKEQGYGGIARALERSEQFIKKEHPYIKFLVDVVEPSCSAYEGRRFGEMFSILGVGPLIERHDDKVLWTKEMEALLELRRTGSIGAVIDHLKSVRRPFVPEEVGSFEAKLGIPNQDLKIQDAIDRVRKLREVPYSEVVALSRFVSEETPFATNHGVKGAEYENVLVVVGRGWNRYDFNRMLELFPTNIAEGDKEFFERNRNLFYVACSRSRKRLAVLFTQELSKPALATLTSWFGSNCIRFAPAGK